MIKINDVFSSWKDLILSVRQGSVLGPLLFNIYLNDLFFFLKDVGICNFADDTTTYISDESLEHVLKLCSKANQKLSALSRMAKLLSFNKKRKPFKAFVLLFGCFIVDILTIKLIGYMREPLELFMMKAFQLLINYLLWTNLSEFSIKISKDS